MSPCLILYLSLFPPVSLRLYPYTAPGRGPRLGYLRLETRWGAPLHFAPGVGAGAAGDGLTADSTGTNAATQPRGRGRFRDNVDRFSLLSPARSPSRHRSPSPSRHRSRSLDNDRQSRHRDHRSRSGSRRRSPSRRSRSRSHDHRRTSSSNKKGELRSKKVHNAIEHIRKRILHTRTAPIFTGNLTDVLDITTCAVIFRDHTLDAFENADDGVLELPTDTQVAPSSTWVTTADRYTRRRRDLLAELISHHNPIYHQLKKHDNVLVLRISGQVDSVPYKEVTTLDWLRLLVRHQAQSPDYQRAATAIFASLTRKPHEHAMTAVARVLDAFRASIANANRPHLTENPFFWCHLTSGDLQRLFERILEVVVPVDERVGFSGLMNQQYSLIDSTIFPLAIEYHDPPSRRIHEGQGNQGAQVVSRFRKRHHITIQNRPRTAQA